MFSCLSCCHLFFSKNYLMIKSGLKTLCFYKKKSLFGTLEKKQKKTEQTQDIFFTHTKFSTCTFAMSAAVDIKPVPFAAELSASALFERLCIFSLPKKFYQSLKAPTLFIALFYVLLESDSSKLFKSKSLLLRPIVFKFFCDN